MEFIPTYDELWVISDIHMGGEKTPERDFQIFCRGERLGNFICHLITLRQNDELALVLNGDVIDSLAEDIVPGYAALDVDTINALMKHIYEDPAFEPVWDALRQFVRSKKRNLVFVIGNHDIELALTPVEASIRQKLAEGDAKVNSRIHFSNHGGGFACRVGGKRVFCTHGNEVDAWNIVDYNALGNLDNAIRAGRRVDPGGWVPNSGTRMVIDLMNKIKASYPFVDLLKPEVKPVLSVALTLKPALLREVNIISSLKIIKDRVVGALEVRNLLSAGGDIDSVPSDQVVADALPALLGQSLLDQIRSEHQLGQSEDELLIAAEVDMVAGKPAIENLGALEGATLGVGDLVSGLLGRTDKVEALRRALSDWLGNDTTFDLTAEDDTYKAIVPRAGPGVDFIVTGHTHLARAIKQDGRQYFNCGTWIRLLRFTTQSLESRESFTKVYNELEKGTMDALDQAEIPGPDGKPVKLVLDRTNAVRISRAKNGTAVKGELLRITGGENGTPINPVPEKGIDK